MQAVVLEAILVIVHGTKPIFKHGREFDESDPHMKLEDDFVRISTCAQRKWAAILVATLVSNYWTKPILGEHSGSVVECLTRD